jgi:hypothetical protein
MLSTGGPPHAVSQRNVNLDLWAVDLVVEVVDPELIEIAKDNVLRAVGDEADPVIESLAEMLGEVGAALLHLDDDDRLPDVIGERGAAAVFAGFADAQLGGAPDFERSLLAEGAEEAVEKYLGFALFIAFDVLRGPIDELV